MEMVKYKTRPMQCPAVGTSPIEQRMDMVVYELYGLTREEIAVVEGR
jgi:hypothetical protein